MNGRDRKIAQSSFFYFLFFELGLRFYQAKRKE